MSFECPLSRLEELHLFDSLRKTLTALDDKRQPNSSEDN